MSKLLNYRNGGNHLTIEAYWKSTQDSQSNVKIAFYFDLLLECKKVVPETQRKTMLVYKPL